MSYFYYLDKLFSENSLSKRSYRYAKDGNNEILAVNVAGFSKEDISIDVKNDGINDYLYISAKPKDDVKDFVEDFKIRFVIYANLIDEISYEVKEGMLYITIVRKDSKPKINIKCK